MSGLQISPTGFIVGSDTLTFNVRDFGAKADGTTDDAAAFSAAWASLKAAVNANSYVPAKLVVPAGTYKIATSINWSGGASTFLGWNVLIEGSGAVLVGSCTGKAVLDMTGVRGVRVVGLAIYGSTTSIPSCGILVGARATDACGNCQFTSVKFSGYYSKACVGNIAVETTTWRDCYFMNDNPASTAYAYAADGAMNLGFTSDYSTLRSPGTTNSLTNNSFSGCRFSKATAGYCVYLERTINWQFHRDNYYLSYDNAAFYINQQTGTTNRDVSIEGLFETTGLKYCVLIVTTDGGTSNLRRFYLDAGSHFGATAAVGVKRSSDLGDMTSGACNISQANIRVNGSATGPNTVPVFSGAKINYTGDIYCDYGAMLNLATLNEFHGQVFCDDLSSGTAPGAASSALVFERANNRIKVYGPLNYVGNQGYGSSGAAVSALTGTTSETILATIPIPANAMGPNGYIRIRTVWSGVTNSANNKTLRHRLGTISDQQHGSVAWTTKTNGTMTCVIQNRNSASSQIGWGVGDRGTDNLQAYTGQTTSALDTTAARNLLITMQLANSGETITLESYSVDVVYGA